MIKYALVCTAEHSFESWFPDSAAYDSQVKRGFVACPVCGTQRVSKAVMAPAVASRRDKTVESPVEVLPAAAPDPREAAMRAMMRDMRRHILENTENVGDKFPEQARQMHEGEIEHRPITGQATPEEVRELIEEGIEIMPVPEFPEDRN